jgi:hypothetical protein
MPHWLYFLYAANALVGAFSWKHLPLTVIRLVGALTKDPERSKRCAEMLRLSRKDAKNLPSYLLDDSNEKEGDTDRGDPAKAVRAAASKAPPPSPAQRSAVRMPAVESRPRVQAESTCLRRR